MSSGPRNTEDGTPTDFSDGEGGTPTGIVEISEAEAAAFGIDVSAESSSELSVEASEPAAPSPAVEAAADPVEVAAPPAEPAPAEAEPARAQKTTGRHAAPSLEQLLAARAAGRRKAAQRPKRPAEQARAASLSTPPPANTESADIAVAAPAPAALGEVAEIADVVEAPPSPAHAIDVVTLPSPTDKLIADLRQKLQTTQETSKTTYDRLVRATADFENLKKRSKREVDDAKSESKGKIIKEILPVFDNLERAIAHADRTSDDLKGIREGVNLVVRQFAQSLERLGVKSIDVMHHPFDPNLHEAVGQKESGEHPAGTVVEVFQKGYVMGERLLRPALVIVSKPPAETPPAAPATETSEVTSEPESPASDSGNSGSEEG